MVSNAPSFELLEKQADGSSSPQPADMPVPTYQRTNCRTGFITEDLNQDSLGEIAALQPVHHHHRQFVSVSMNYTFIVVHNIICLLTVHLLLDMYLLMRITYLLLAKHLLLRTVHLLPLRTSMNIVTSGTTTTYTHT